MSNFGREGPRGIINPWSLSVAKSTSFEPKPKIMKFIMPLFAPHMCDLSSIVPCWETRILFFDFVCLYFLSDYPNSVIRWYQPYHCGIISNPRIDHCIASYPDCDTWVNMFILKILHPPATQNRLDFSIPFGRVVDPITTTAIPVICFIAFSDSHNPNPVV